MALSTLKEMDPFYRKLILIFNGNLEKVIILQVEFYVLHDNIAELRYICVLYKDGAEIQGLLILIFFQNFGFHLIFT